VHHLSSAHTLFHFQRAQQVMEWAIPLFLKIAQGESSLSQNIIAPLEIGNLLINTAKI
jgi:hypothetical protein